MGKCQTIGQSTDALLLFEQNPLKTTNGWFTFSPSTQGPAQKKPRGGLRADSGQSGVALEDLQEAQYRFKLPLISSYILKIFSPETACRRNCGTTCWAIEDKVATKMACTRIRFSKGTPDAWEGRVGSRPQSITSLLLDLEDPVDPLRNRTKNK